jgi:hypothetical protein
MSTDPHRVSIELTPIQFEALTKLSKTEKCDLTDLVSRGVDCFIATYQAGTQASVVEIQLNTMHRQTVDLLIAAMKLIGQCLYFSSLPLRTGPLKGKLNAEGIALQWHESKEFSKDLLSPPAAPKSSD